MSDIYPEKCSSVFFFFFLFLFFFLLYLNLTFFRWGDWLCITNSDNNHAFKPICQKDKDAKDFGGKDNDNEDLVDPNAGNQGNSNNGNDDNEDSDDGGNTLADQLSCFDENVIYKAPKNNRYFFGIFKICMCTCVIRNF